MRFSLLFKLLGAFLLVIAIGTAVIFWTTSQATQTAFNIYSTRNGQAWAQRLAPALADYYLQNGGWQGVDTLIQTDLPASGMGINHPAGNGNGQGLGMGRLFAGAGMGAGMGQRIILASELGVVISDSRGEMNATQLSSSDLKNGIPVMVGDKEVGILMIGPNDFAGAATPAGEFLASVNQSIIVSAVIAGGLALLLGALLFFQITAPLRQLKMAAHAIAKGDMAQRVNIKSKDEFGDLGETFNVMADSLMKSENQRHNMAADIAHELRTPLAVIRANLEGFKDDVIPLDMAHINAIYSETLLLNRIVDDLRLLTLAEAGELKLEYGSINLEHLTQQVVEHSSPQAAQKGLKLETNIANSLPEVWADSDRITQVLNNLITNAMRYTPAGGIIKVVVHPLSDKDQFIQVSVIDTGSGISAEMLPYVFDRFYRADKSRTRSSGGSGLGLAIVKQMVEAHGGKVEAESPVFKDENKPGYGTRISFTIPVKQNLQL
jgi:signal transduction histidine kinase